MEPHFTYRGAAKRVGRSIITIKRWRRNGMPMSFDAEGRRIVAESTLLATFRACLAADPIHQARLRVKLATATKRREAAVDNVRATDGVD